MITVENDYESITYEEPFCSHIYENQLELLNNYYLGPNNNNTQPPRKYTKLTRKIHLTKTKSKT